MLTINIEKNEHFFLTKKMTQGAEFRAALALIHRTKQLNETEIINEG